LAITKSAVIDPTFFPSGLFATQIFLKSGELHLPFVPGKLCLYVKIRKRVHEQQVNICEIDSIINILWLPKQRFKSIVFIKIRERVHEQDKYM
jgi:hypothetical protein